MPAMMKFLLLLFAAFLGYGCRTDKHGRSHYVQNRSPLKAKAYLELPIGLIKPDGWLHTQLLSMKNGLTGHLDEIYPQVVGPRNGWLGGDGDGWERGPYWIDGLLPLAYILDDAELKAKVQPWIEWTINNQQKDGYVGPVPFESEPEPEAGLQKSMRRDWWPKMVMLKILQQYYSATGDKRVITTLTNYFRYQLQQLPATPLDNWTFWANRRGGDNLMVVYWLYNITGDAFLLELGDLIAKQTFPWADVFLNEENGVQASSPWHYFDMKMYPFNKEEIANLTVSQMGGIHCVNFAQGLKQPLVYYQQYPDERLYNSVKKALRDIKKYHGQPQGMFGGDEGLHGRNPVQGVEFCSVSELMFSLETMLAITGDTEFADQLERIAYNALPTQAADDFKSRQYFQTANQVELSDRLSASFQTERHHHTDFVYGVLTGYPCCTTNMHQSWPKFVQNLWYATPDRGVAAMLYGPSTVTLKVGDDLNATITETTGFPFRETVDFTLKLDGSGTFPFHLRVPEWSDEVEIRVNGEVWDGSAENHIAILQREWNDGDKIRLAMPMKVRTSEWFEFTRSVERGPLVYALRIESETKNKNRNDGYGPFEEVYPASKWNYALVSEDLKNQGTGFVVEELNWDGSYPWNLQNIPIQIRGRGASFAEWTLTNGLPSIPAWWQRTVPKETKLESLILIPYGATTLRITEFPVFDME